MAAKGTKKTKTTKAPSGVQPINVPYWAPSWGGNRANVPVPGPGYWDFNVPLGYNPDGSPVTAPGINPNLASPAAPTSAAPNIPPYNPQPNPYSLGAGAGNEPYAPVNTGVGGSGSPGHPDYDYWYKLSKDEDWSAEEQAAYLAQFYGQTDEYGNLIAVGNPRWGDPYQVFPYWKYNKPTSVTGGSYKRPMYNGKEPREHEYRGLERDEYGRWVVPANKDKIGSELPAWVGPLVSWRT